MGMAEATFFRDPWGISFPADLRELSEAFEMCLTSAWSWWIDGSVALVRDRPCEVHCEEPGPGAAEGPRLHSDTGRAIAWRDGWSLWYIHGVQVGQRVVEAPETLTARQILAEPDVHGRRMMIDRFGAGRLVLEGNPEIADLDQDQFGEVRPHGQDDFPGSRWARQPAGGGKPRPLGSEHGGGPGRHPAATGYRFPGRQAPPAGVG